MIVKIHLTEAERDSVSRNMDFFRAGFDELETIDTKNADPLVTVLDIINIMREDIAVKNLSRDEILWNAPESYDGFFRAPRTII